MESSFKLKVQNAARNLRKEQQKLYNMLNKLEDSSSTFDFFDHDKKKEANGYKFVVKNLDLDTMRSKMNFKSMLLKI